MDRKQWLTLVYREANLFLEQHDDLREPLTAEQLEDLEPELSAQLLEVLRTTDSLEDLLKHSLLKQPAMELWRNEEEWPQVLLRVAGACLLFDVQGVIQKVLEGELPRIASHTLSEPPE